MGRVFLGPGKHACLAGTLLSCICYLHSPFSGCREEEGGIWGRKSGESAPSLLNKVSGVLVDLWARPGGAGSPETHLPVNLITSLLRGAFSFSASSRNWGVWGEGVGGRGQVRKEGPGQVSRTTPPTVYLSLLSSPQR